MSASSAYQDLTSIKQPISFTKTAIECLQRRQLSWQDLLRQFSHRKIAFESMAFDTDLYYAESLESLNRQTEIKI